jgi:hypothetical protein
MIYVVEFPHESRPKAWFAFDQDDFIRKVRAARIQDASTIFEAGSPRSWLGSVGLTPETASANDTHGWIFELAINHGWDTSLYRADHLLGPGVYQTQPVSEFDACIAALGSDLQACRVYLSDNAATAALYSDPVYDVREGFHAHMALREQLIALEVIADDY